MNPLAEIWLRAARDPAIAAELTAVYSLAADQIAARGPACWASGRCCNFTRAGHRLYVTGLEAAFTVSRLDIPLTPESLDAALLRGDCPFLHSHLCSVHAVKPLGCRVFFCDRSAAPWQQDLSERCLTLIRTIHERRTLPYRYGEWRTMLAEFLREPLTASASPALRGG